MDVNYWNRVGHKYEAEIFSVCHNDKNRIIPKTLIRYYNPSHVAADFGCGIGSFLPLLSPGFKKVHAVDFARSCLKKARTIYCGLDNVVFHKHNLMDRNLGFGKVNFAFCSNVIISPSISMRSKILKNIYHHLLKNGHLLLITPSLESALFSGYRLIQWNLKSGLSAASAVRSGFQQGQISKTKFFQGIIDIDQVGTKHFLREELQVLLNNMKFEVLEITKIIYDWETEFNDPPDWMKAPYPWDWLVVARKR